MSGVIVYKVEVGEWVLPELLFYIHGLKESQINNYRCKGQWLEGQEYKRNPANRIVYNTEAVAKWMARNPNT